MPLEASDMSPFPSSGSSRCASQLGPSQIWQGPGSIISRRVEHNTYALGAIEKETSGRAGWVSVGRTTSAVLVQPPLLPERETTTV